VTCHDLLAVRGALGEDTDCPASFTGRLLQRSILRGLRRADAVACVSGATLRDARRLLNDYRGQLVIAPNALNYAYRPLPRDVVQHRLSKVGLGEGEPYVLHVGSNLRRKNRECALRAIAAVAGEWPGRVVFAGQPLTPPLWTLARELGIEHRVTEIAKPDNESLEALYNGALALLFPSRFEGFGWPIAEAQAAGCPVICSNREPFPEVAGDAALMCDADDHAGFGRAILSLARDQVQRADLVCRGLGNARRFAPAAMIQRFEALYANLLVRA
jgi:glycosyltransferase involved in cell wall biosynthesis